jgi:hypothetical protein
MSLTPEQIKNQSLTALKQWRSQWEAHCKQVSKYDMRPLSDFEATGAGKACLLIANGWSFEREIETIKKHQGNVDIFVCDKTLGHCLENGIVPTYVIVCDANVSYEKYLEPWKDRLQDTILIQNCCANPKWAENGNWKDRYFFLVKDAIQSEEIFMPISGCKNLIAAGTNVSNSMVILMTQCDNKVKQNFFGYDKYILIGFDYCWTPEGNYYAFDHEGGGKRYYMKHIYGRTLEGGLCYTSNNLAFSMKWLQQYVDVFRLPVVQCSASSVFQVGGQKPQNLAKQMQYKGRLNAGVLRDALKKSRELFESQRKINEALSEMGKQQFYDFAASM